MNNNVCVSVYVYWLCASDDQTGGRRHDEAIWQIDRYDHALP